MRFHNPIGISGIALITLAFFVLVLPMEWLTAAFLAGLVHEASHYLTVKLFGGKISFLRIGANGTVMYSTYADNWKNLVCILAGPVGGLSLLLFARWLPRTAVCAALQSAYNLLPIYPLDGGNALRCGLRMLTSTASADIICRYTEHVIRIFLGVLLFLCIFRWKLGIMPIFPTVFLFLRTCSRQSESTDIFPDQL